MPSFAPGCEDLPAPLAGFWAERHLCTLTTLRADGSPHVVPFRTSRALRDQGIRSPASTGAEIVLSGGASGQSQASS